MAGDRRLFLASDNIYPLTHSTAPGGLYVDCRFWFFLNKDDLDGRLVAAVARHPDMPILFAEPLEDWAVPARKTRLYRFLTEETIAVARIDDRTSWRAVRPAAR